MNCIVMCYLYMYFTTSLLKNRIACTDILYAFLVVCAERYSRAAGELPGSHDG